MHKKELRSLIREKRKSIPLDRKKELDTIIQKSIISQPKFKSSHIIMTYVALNEEVSTDLLIEEAFREGKRIVVPYCNENSKIGLAEICSLEELKVGAFGIREPLEICRDNIREELIDLVIVPGVAFDKEGNRLGMGKGFYDRFLQTAKSHSYWIAPTYECQMVESIPLEEHDLPVDMIVTEASTYPS